MSQYYITCKHRASSCFILQELKMNKVKEVRVLSIKGFFILFCVTFSTSHRRVYVCLSIVERIVSLILCVSFLFNHLVLFMLCTISFFNHLVLFMNLKHSTNYCGLNILRNNKWQDSCMIFVLIIYFKH